MQHCFILQTISRDLMIEDEMGKMFPAIKVFSMSIAALVKDMVSAGGKTKFSGLRKSDVHWVLTVPAIWSDAAKQFMREAAEMVSVISIIIEIMNISSWHRTFSIPNFATFIFSLILQSFT